MLMLAVVSAADLFDASAVIIRSLLFTILRHQIVTMTACRGRYRIYSNAVRLALAARWLCIVTV